ncbi:chromosome segregation protein SMC [Cupriavidus oxalaticus]|uniref:chromosome segregation protein SMC n=1 Tax=Cupriavidus oxalaticus TaxID=96344 RepID=UPI0040349194
MSRQPDLFADEPLKITPRMGEKEPRLWVRRLTLWKDAETIIRDIPLRPGLNIVWSPDPAEAGDSTDSSRLGHGSGKTLFCRLLRYCLGEQGHSTDEQRQHIAIAFPEGRVTAEVILCGELWGVVRPLGLSREHYAVQGQLPRALLESPPEPTGMAPLIEAIQHQVLTEPIAALMQSERAHDPWLIALAWLTRDQECRFDKVLDWRAADSESGSPVRSMSQTRVLEALRALLGAIGAEELEARTEIAKIEEGAKATGTEVDRLLWQVKRSRREAAEAVGLTVEDLPEGKLCVDVLRRTAADLLAKLAKVDSADLQGDVAELRAKYEAQQSVVAELEKSETAAKNTAAVLKGLLPTLRGELAVGTLQVHDAGSPVCLVCEVPIDRALAEGCGLSHKIPDLEGLRRRTKQLEDKVRQCELDLRANEAALREATQALPVARTRQREMKKAVEAAEKSLNARAGAWRGAQTAREGAKRLADLYEELDAARAKSDKQAEVMDAKREKLSTYREVAQRATFDELSAQFDAVIRALIAPESSGRVLLGADRLKLNIELGGTRSTAAIESLKVIAFDLAALCMSIEGRSYIPGFLVHDSPREADLGLSVYRRLFELIAGLEEVGPILFQYIVTTTTSPPSHLCAKPWLVETLFGSPSNRRLLGVDL